MIKFRQSGSLKATENFLKRDNRSKVRAIMERYGERGVDALRSATPRETGLTAESWYYEIRTNGTIATIEWKNKNIVNGVSVAIVLQYGHATGSGGYVEGVDYINPALRPIFDAISRDIGKEVGGA